MAQTEEPKQAKELTQKEESEPYSKHAKEPGHGLVPESLLIVVAHFQLYYSFPQKEWKYPSKTLNQSPYEDRWMTPEEGLQ